MIVRKLRLQRSWSQEHLAQLTGLNVRTIQRLERGTKMSLETRAALAAVFEVDAATFEPGAAPVSDPTHVSPDEREAIEYVKGIKEFYTHLSMYLVFAVVFSFAFGIHHPIILWGAIGWGIGVIIHALNVYEVINLFGPSWERRQIEKRLGRKL